MRNKLLAGAAAILLSGTFAMGAFADNRPRDASPEARAKMAQSFCTDRTARTASHLTYLETKLKPTAAQQAAWKKYSDAVTTNAAAQEKDCLARPVRDRDEGRPSIVERQAMRQKALEAQLASLKVTTPPLEALYATLSDEQKAVLDRGDGRDGLRHFSHWRGGDRHHGKMHKIRFDGDRKAPPAEEAPVPEAE